MLRRHFIRPIQTNGWAYIPLYSIISSCVLMLYPDRPSICVHIIFNVHCIIHDAQSTFRSSPLCIYIYIFLHHPKFPPLFLSIKSWCPPSSPSSIRRSPRPQLPRVSSHTSTPSLRSSARRPMEIPWVGRVRSLPRREMNCPWKL